LLKCDGLTLAVPGRVLAREVRFEANRGETWAVLGANGSGKTTLMHALAGLAPAMRAAIALDGKPLGGRGARERAALSGILLQQEDAAFWGEVLEYVLLGRFAHARTVFGWSREDEDASRAALAAVGLDGFERRSYRTLSGGERQRARIAQLLAQDPQLFLLDEPLQHLDLRHQVAVLRLFGSLARKRGKAVIMVLHDALWPAQACSHALLLYGNGVMESGAASAMLTRDRLERLYGCPLREIAVEGTSFFAPV
jgi:iron complex transport system ATP-binding protein